MRPVKPDHRMASNKNRGTRETLVSAAASEVGIGADRDGRMSQTKQMTTNNEKKKTQIEQLQIKLQSPGLADGPPARG